jgi:K+ transporter
MDQLTYVFLVVVLAAVMMWVFIKSNRLQHLVKIVYLVVWMLFSTALPIYAVIAFHIPKGDYTAVIFTIALMMFMAFVWWRIGWPELHRSMKEKASSYPWWNA